MQHPHACSCDGFALAPMRQHRSRHSTDSVSCCDDTAIDSAGVAAWVLGQIYSPCVTDFINRIWDPLFLELNILVSRARILVVTSELCYARSEISPCLISLLFPGFSLYFCLHVCRLCSNILVRPCLVDGSVH
jgi:hypothetical protein